MHDRHVLSLGMAAHLNILICQFYRTHLQLLKKAGSKNQVLLG